MSERLLTSLLFVSAVFFGSCNPNPIEVKNSVVYGVTMDILWSGDTYPEDFPHKGSYVGPLVGIVHDETINMFINTKPATDGLKEFATKGSKKGLVKGLSKYLKSHKVSQFIIEDFREKAPGRHEFEVNFYPDRDFAMLSIACNIGPSPDWFLAARNVQIRKNKVFLKDIVVDLKPFDAGVDSGSTYLSEPDEQDVPNSVSNIVSGPLASGTGPIVRLTMKSIP